MATVRLRGNRTFSICMRIPRRRSLQDLAARLVARMLSRLTRIGELVLLTGMPVVFAETAYQWIDHG